MTQQEVFEGLKEVLAMVKPKTDLSKVEIGNNLITDLGIDSLTMLLLSIAVEGKWGIEIDSKVHFVTVGDVIDYVCANCKS